MDADALIHANERYERFLETATQEQKIALQCLYLAAQEVMQDSMKDSVLAVTYCSQRDLYGHRPVNHLHFFDDAEKLADFYEYCAKRIREKNNEHG